MESQVPAAGDESAVAGPPYLIFRVSIGPVTVPSAPVEVPAELLAYAPATGELDLEADDPLGAWARGVLAPMEQAGRDFAQALGFQLVEEGQVRE